MTTNQTPLPSIATLLGQQLAVIGGGLRREAAALAGILVLLCIFAALGGFGRSALVVEPYFLIFTLPIAALLPIAVWRGENVFGRSYLWSLPARRQYSAIARVAAGALWLLAAMAVTMLVLWFLAWASGGQMGITEVRLVSPVASLSDAVERSWSTPSWEYVAPFTAGLIVYFVSSAALLGLRHPMRWILGAALGSAILVAFVLQTLPGTPLALGMEAVRHNLWLGDFGLNHALTAGNDGLANQLELPDGATQVIWLDLPSMELWLRAVAAWMLAALSLLSIAIWRHAEP